MKCVIYIRVSTDEQAKHGYSIVAQQERLDAFCKSQGWNIIGTYIDDGYSAKDLNRPHFQKMMDRIKQGNVDVLLVYRLDRLTRSVLDLYQVLNTLEAYNCKFRSATEVYDTTSAMGKLFITLVAAIAQWERENTAERVSMGMEKKAKLGEWPGGTPPYGYKLENEKLVIDEEEAKVVKEIFKMAETTGFYTIARKLTEKGYLTRSGENWHVDTIRGIANNPVYAGYIRYNEGGKNYKKPPRKQKLYEGKQEKIISREDFWNLQDYLDKRRSYGGKREVSNYYFSTILKCGRCGSSMSGHLSPSGKTYRCSGKKSGKKCTSHIIKEDNLVKAVFKYINTIEFKGNTEATDVTEEKIKQLEIELSRIKKLMSKKKIMYEKDIIDIDELIKETNELRANEKRINNEIKELRKKIGNTDEITFIKENLNDLWKDADDFERKKIMTTLFSQIVVDTKEEYIRGKGIPREIIIKSVK